MKFKKNYICKTCGKQFIYYKIYKYKYCSSECAYLYRSIPTYKKFKQYLKGVSRDFLIWFTGFWEGEGCITRRYNNRSYSINVSQNNKSIMLEIKRNLKIGKIYSSKLKSGNLHYHFIIANLGATLALAETILSFTKIEKRKKELSNVINFEKSKRIRQYA
jgi:hypothetical protein